MSGNVVFLPRIILSPSDTGLPFQLKRKQIPIRLAFAITINKAQGQTFNKLGIYLPEPVFSHGQLYVAFSRVGKISNVKIKIENNSEQGQFKGKIPNASMLNVHEAIKPLYYLSRSVNLWPYKYEKCNKIVALTIADKTRAWVLLTAIVIFYIWCIYMRIQFILEATVSSTMSTIFTLCAHSHVVFSIVLANSSFGDSTKMFFIKLEYITKKIVIHTRGRFNDLYKILLIQLIVIFGIGTISNVVHIGLYWYVDYMIVVRFTSTYITHYMFFIILLQILCKVEFLIRCFKHLNDNFANFPRNSIIRTISVVHNDITHSKWTPNHIRELCKIHKQLCNLIQTINDAHGWQIAIMFLVTVALSLTCMCYGLIEGVMHIAQRDDFVNVRKVLLFKEIANVLFHCALLVLLSIKCSVATKEALKTGLLANDILMDLQSENSSKSDEIYKEQLQLLVQHISSRNIHFSAADMFTVNHGMIPMLAGTITTYFIVCLQFTPNRNI